MNKVTNMFGKFNLLKSNDEETGKLDTTVDSITPDTSASDSSTRGKQGLMSFFKSDPVIEQAPPVPDTWHGKLIAKLPESPQKMKGLVGFALAALCMLMTATFLMTFAWTMAIRIFTIGVICCFTGLILWNGPQAYVKKCIEK